MSRVTVLGPNLNSTDETFHVHATGCADIRRSKVYVGAVKWASQMEVQTLQDVVEDTYQDQIAESEGLWATWEPYASDFRVFPCVTWDGAL
jgi:hypothetical protein